MYNKGASGEAAVEHYLSSADIYMGKYTLYCLDLES